MLEVSICTSTVKQKQNPHSGGTIYVSFVSKELTDEGIAIPRTPTFNSSTKNRRGLGARLETVINVYQVMAPIITILPGVYPEYEKSKQSLELNTQLLI